MTKKNSILVVSCHLYDQVKSDITDALDSLLSQGCCFKISENPRIAHLLVIDVDADAGRKQLETSLPGQVKLLLSSNKESGKNIVCIQKPVNIQTTTKVLNKLFTMMYAQMVKVDTIDNNEKKTVTSITDSIFYSLLQAKKNRQLLHITSCAAEIFIDGINQTIKIDGTLEDLRKLLNAPFSELVIKDIHEVLPEKSNSLQVIALHSALWTAAIICSRGILLPELNIHEPVQLRAWPGFTRNDFKPEHLKLAAILAQRPISLADLEQQTKIPYEDIVNFFNAVYAVDLLEQNMMQKDVHSQSLQTKKTVIKSTLLNKIAARLGLNQRSYGTYHG